MTPQNNPTCSAVRELAVWRANGDLDTGEAARVDAHLEQCGGCRDFLRFATSIKQRVDEVADHPASEFLVRYAEDPSVLKSGDAGAIEEHLLLCRNCAAELKILHEVQTDEASPQAEPVLLPRKASSASHRDRPAAGIVRLLARALFHPIPAAGYLALALILAGVLIQRAGRAPDRSPGDGPAVANPAFPGSLGPVVRLADAPHEVRDGVQPPPDLPLIDGNRLQFLLLEFTDLERPPEVNAEYRVEITAAGGNRPIWTAGVTGADFRENYTLCVALQPGALKPGRYLLATTGPSGTVLLRAALQVR